MKKIPITQNQYALVDDADFEGLSKFKWYAKWDRKTESFYVGRNLKNEQGKWTSITMHRQIVNAGSGFQVDHINHNTLDNRRENLRFVSNTENQYNQKISKKNTSGYKGVSWSKNNKKWQAYIRKDKILKSLGYFSVPEDAARAYNTAADELFRQYSYLNKI